MADVWSSIWNKNKENWNNINNLKDKFSISNPFSSSGSSSSSSSSNDAVKGQIALRWLRENLSLIHI